MEERIDECGFDADLYDSLRTGFGLNENSFEEFIALNGYLGLLTALLSKLDEDKTAHEWKFVHKLRIMNEIANAEACIDSLFDGEIPLESVDIVL